MKLNIFSIPSLHKLSTSANNPIPQNFGSIYHTNFSFFTTVTFPSTYKNNPKTKISVILRSTNETTIRKLFDLGFRQYKYLEIIAININSTMKNGRDIENITAFAYNPFRVDGDKLNRRVLNETNVDAEMKSIAQFMKKRYENFFGHPLKVFDSQSVLKY